MPSLALRHKVADYATWKPLFDADGATRRANGSQDSRVFRNAADPNEVLALFEWDDPDRARLFAQSDDLRETLERDGVVDRPDLWFLEETSQPPSPATPTIKPYARSQGAGASAWFHGNTLITFLATGEDTGGQFAVLEFRSRKGSEPPPHVHQDEHECFYVVAGEVSFHVADQTFHGRAGSWVVVPRGTVHSFALDSDEATMLVFFTPAGFERFFQEMSVPATSVTTPPVHTDPPDIPRLLATAAKFGCTFVAPS